MPIYAYKCDACGHAKDALQKISDAPLTDCPACGVAAFKKQLTAAGFQLKGSGWYVTDFRDGNKNGAPAAKPGDAGDKGDNRPAGDGKPADGNAPSADAGATANAAPAASTTPAAPAAGPAANGSAASTLSASGSASGAGNSPAAKST